MEQEEPLEIVGLSRVVWTAWIAGSRQLYLLLSQLLSIQARDELLTRMFASQDSVLSHWRS